MPTKPFLSILRILWVECIKAPPSPLTRYWMGWSAIQIRLPAGWSVTPVGTVRA
jgi:hypothetical protein